MIHVFIVAIFSVMNSRSCSSELNLSKHGKKSFAAWSFSFRHTLLIRQSSFPGPSIFVVLVLFFKSIENALFKPQIFIVRLPAYFGAQLMLNFKRS